MIFLTVFQVLSTLTKIHSNTVTSPQIRILDVATKASESRLIPHPVEHRNTFHPYFQQQNHYDQSSGPLKSYIIYDDYPLKIFKEWKANPPSDPQNYLELKRQQNAEFPRDYYYNFQNKQRILPPPKPTLAYHSVYSNVIKVFDSSLEGFNQNRFQSERYIKPFERDHWKSQNPIKYESIYPQDIPRRSLYHNLRLPENFPEVFSPNENFRFPSIDDTVPSPQKFFYPQKGFYDVFAINYNKETSRHPEEVEVLSEAPLRQKIPKKTFLCSFIRVNKRQFPENGGPCSRSEEDLPLVLPQYPDYSSLPNDKIPVEHRRQHFQMKRIKRSELNESNGSRQKREAGFGYGYNGWGSPFSYENGYEGYFGNSYPSRGGYRNTYSSGYTSGRNRNQGYRSKYFSGSQYDDHDEDYQNDDSNSRGLTGYLTNGGRRYKNRKNNNDDDDEDDENENSSNNHEDDSEEEMEQMNSNRRDTNDRRNNDDSRDRRRNNNNSNNNNNNNNNNNDDDDYRDNRRSNNRNNNSRKYNNNNNNNRRNNERFDYGSNRNRYYGNSNGYNNGYGSSYGGYGSNYGGSYGSGGYGSGYGSNRGYGYGGYGNGFASF